MKADVLLPSVATKYTIVPGMGTLVRFKGQDYDLSKITLAEAETLEKAGVLVAVQAAPAKPTSEKK